MTTRRDFMALAGAAGLSAGLGQSARAQGTVGGWPSRSVRVISPTATGGPGQNFRFYADHLKDTFGQSFVLENMPGGSGSVGCMAVARAAPDGLTLLLASNSHIVLAPLVLTGSPVNVKRDFAPIALMFTFPFLLVVNPDLGVKTLKELVDYAKARPGQLNWGSPGVGTGGHLVTELLLKRTGIQGQHVPYPGTTQQLMAAAAGTLQFTFDTPGNSQRRRRRRQGDPARRHRPQALGLRARRADVQGAGLRRLRRSVCRQRSAGADRHAERDDRGLQPRDGEDEFERHDPRPAGRQRPTCPARSRRRNTAR